MRLSQKIIAFLLLISSVHFSQTLTCPSPYVFMDGGSNISAYDPSLPLSSTNPFSTGIPTFGSGLTLMPNINGGTLTPTFYTVSGGNYYYWSGSGWVNTGHSTGNSSAVNIAGCNGTIYNIVGGTGQIYSYNGTSNGSLLTTISGFNGGGPYDLVTDCNCNFYTLNTTTPNQALTMYNPSGTSQCTYTLSGMPNTTAGGGFAIIGNMIYVKNNVSSPGGFYIGTIGASGVSFTAVTGFTNSPGDFASCPVCNPNNDLNGSTISGSAIGCNTPTTNLVVTTTASAVSYSWTGPGIVGSTTNSYVVANAAGIYSCFVTASGCPPAQVTLTTAVTSNVVNVLAALSPSGTICMLGNNPTPLNVVHTSTSDVVVWTGSSISPINSTDTITATQAGSYTVTVTDIFSGCTGTSAVNIIQSPSVSLALSDNTLCLYPYNNSPNSITLTPSGATNYTLLTSTNYSTNTPNASTSMVLYPVTINGNLSPLASATLIGASSICVDTTISAFTILPNPTITLSQASASICPGLSHVFSVSGASAYVWGGGTGLNTLSGPNVTATPVSTSNYSVMGNDNACNSITKNFTLTVLPIPSVFVNPNSSTICLGSSVTLTASGSAATFSWLPNQGLSSNNGAIVSASPANTQVYTVTGYLNSCTNTANTVVHVVTPPILSLGLSSSTFCAQNFNNSPVSINLIPGGANNYTLLAGTAVTILSPNGPTMQVFPSGPPVSTPLALTATLIGESGVCSVSITKTFTIIPNPTISLNPSNAAICPLQSQSFSVSGASTFNWLPMNNYTLTSASSIIANPPYTGFYSVFGSSSGCQSDTKSAVLVVLPVPSLTVAAQSPSVCYGSTVSLNAGGDGQSYSWYPSNALLFNYGSQVSAYPLSTQEYTVISTLNTCTSQAKVTVSVIPIPTISAVVSQPTVCSGAITNLSAFGASSYQWIPSTFLNSNSGNLVQSRPDVNTSYTIRGYNGVCTGSTSISVTVLKRPDMLLHAESNRMCVGESLPITVTGAQVYQWLPSEHLISAANGSFIIAKPLTNTNYTVIGSTTMGTLTCSQQLSYSVMVVPLIKPSVTDNISICEGQKVLLTASGGNTYSWNPSAGLNLTNANKVVASPSITTIYTVQVSDNTYCGQSTTVMVGVSPLPKVYAGADTTANLNDAIFIHSLGTGTLSWISGEDIVCRDCPYTQIYPTRSGCYMAEAKNEFGCTAVDDICIDLTEEFSVYIPNSFTPNNDGLNDLFLIYGEHFYDVSIEIYDRWGLLVFSSNDVKVAWDGTNKGKLCAPDTYTYKLRYTGLNRKKYNKTGHVFIIR